MYKKTVKHSQRVVFGKPKKKSLLKQIKTVQDSLELLPTENTKINYPKNRVGQQPGKACNSKKNRQQLERRRIRDEEIKLKHERLKALREANTIQPHVEAKTNEISVELNDIRNRKQEQLTERKNSVIVDGFIYLVICKSFPEWVKIGQTTDYIKRLQVYQTCSPYSDYEMIFKKYVKDRVLAEQQLLSLMKNKYEVKGEWVKASPEAIIDIIKTLMNK